MNNKNKHKLFIILAIVAVIILILIWGKVAAKIEAVKPKMIFFYGDTCPHCQNVEKYINDNGVRDKLKFQELEVSNNQTNAQLLERKARQCGLDTTQGLSIPFFFDGQKCLLGDQDIINYFQK